MTEVQIGEQVTNVGIGQYLIAIIALTKKNPIGASLLKMSLCSKDELSLRGFRNITY